jgi:hypothetical protein
LKPELKLLNRLLELLFLLLKVNENPEEDSVFFLEPLEAKANSNPAAN